MNFVRLILKKHVLLLITGLLLPLNPAHSVIYNEDNRHDIKKYPNTFFQEKALSVAGMIPSQRLSPYKKDPNLLKYKKVKLSKAFHLCKGERFSEQNTLAQCTGFLIAPDILVTAGHCVKDQKECSEQSWIFDYSGKESFISKKNVYQCQKILGREKVNRYFKTKDYAVIKLDRKSKRAPLKYRKKGKVSVGTELIMIGHSLGIPLKIHDQAKVRRAHWRELINPIRKKLQRRYYFLTDLDAFSSASGSPVFNKKTGLVEGIFIDGSSDFTFNSKKDCYQYRVKKNTALGPEEIVYRINKVDYLNKK